MIKGIKTIGLISGGQLGKFLAQVASNWGLSVSVLDPVDSCPAKPFAHVTLGDSLIADEVIRFAKNFDLVTCEKEAVSVEGLRALQKSGVRVFPDPDQLELIQDKGLQKEFFEKQKINSSAFSLFNNAQEIRDAVLQNKLALPFVQKLRKGGYDGKGVQIIRDQKDLDNLFNDASLVEDLIAIKKEVSQIVVRDQQGHIAVYEPVDMTMDPQDNLLKELVCPANLDQKQSDQIKEMAKALANAFGIVGLLAVEFIISESNEIFVNEVSPRPHNSGHHTIETCLTSQYEQHLRAILALPLGKVDQHLPCVMINILGEPGHEGEPVYQGIEDCLQVDGVYFHLYGKAVTKPARKMGHVTIVGKTAEEAAQKAELVKSKLRVVS